MTPDGDGAAVDAPPEADEGDEHHGLGDELGHPIQWTRRLLRTGWRQMRSVYYANSFSWRWLKSGALLFFGFFCWTSSNILLSYQPGWRWLYLPMAYGFVLIPYGPFTHLAMVPLTIRLRKKGHPLGRHLTKLNLGLFVLIVVVLAAYPPGVMAFEFTGIGAGDGGAADVAPELICTSATTDAGAEAVHCHLSNGTGVDAVVVRSSGEQIARDDDPPFSFTIAESSIREVVGQKQFQVVLRDENGATVRRYTRTLSMIEEAE